MESKEEPEREHRPTVKYSPGGVMVASIMAFFAIVGGIGHDASAFVSCMTTSLILFVRSFSPPSPPLSVRRGCLTFFGGLLAGGWMVIFTTCEMTFTLRHVLVLILTGVPCVLLIGFGFQHPKKNER